MILVTWAFGVGNSAVMGLLGMLEFASGPSVYTMT